MTTFSLAPPARLRELLKPVSIETLINHLDSGSLLHLSAPRPDRFDALFSWTHLDRLLTQRPTATNRFFVFAGGRQLDPTKLGAVDRNGRIDPVVVRSLFDQGATFSLPNIQAQFDETQQLVRDVERQIGERVELRVIASASSSTPIPLHFDSPDLLVLQIEGEKQWSFFGAPVDGSGRYRTLDEPPRDISARVLLRRGDVLFMPSGLHHQCQAEGDSLHLAISIYRRTGMDFLDHLRTQAADDIGLFDGLPNRASGAAIAEREAQLRQRFIRLIEAADLGAFLRARRKPPH